MQLVYTNEINVVRILIISLTPQNGKDSDTRKFISALKSSPWDCAFLFEYVDEILDMDDILKSVIYK